MPLIFSRRQLVQNFLHDEDMLAWLFIFHEVIFKTSPSHQPLNTPANVGSFPSSLTRFFGALSTERASGQGWGDR